MHPLISELHQDHINLSRLLDLLERESMLFRRGEDPDYFLMLDMVEYVESYPDLIHHPREDAIFRVYLERHHEGEDVIQQLTDEHKALVAHSHRLRDMLEEVLQGSVLSREIIETQLFTYIEMQRSHLNAEEAQVFELMDEALEPEDWARIKQMIPATDDPLFGGQVQKRYEAIYAQILAIA
ncbi:MAG TPA: hemerythrin domain-containing protein [Methylococcaceae bacterium]|jgi:hemerythrin-like domain-containing protein|nr:hemerythrin domain-containing protein [Methylococcaceae bacterium]